MTRTRRAFTLFQLLVILAILALLFALLLPAVAKVRLAAARSQSQNNLKQIGLACHNYADTNGKFCPGNDANNFSAFAYLLPYIEQDNLFKLIDFRKPSDDKANAQVRATLVKTFLNPSDMQQIVKDGNGPTNYLFNAGSLTDLKGNNGIFYLDSGVKFQDVTDGTSNTLMAGETLKGDGNTKAVSVARQYIKLGKDALNGLTDNSGDQEWKDGKNIAGDRGAAWIDGRFLQGTFTGTRMINDAKPDVSCDGQGGLSGLRGLQDVVSVLMCDGSTRVANKGVPIQTLKNLSQRNDGNVIGDF